jgi:hypothetical protein
MLAVVIFPHRSITVLMDAATLSQAHLIQPGRALGAEPQVRSSFREFLQLHLRLFVSHRTHRLQERGPFMLGQLERLVPVAAA